MTQLPLYGSVSECTAAAEKWPARSKEPGPIVTAAKTKWADEQYAIRKVLLEKFAGVRDSPSPALGIKWV